MSPLPVSNASPAPKPKVERSAVAPSREGKVHIGAYLNPDIKRGLRMVHAITGDIQALLARGRFRSRLLALFRFSGLSR